MIWINAVLYQLTWLAAVAGAGYGAWWAGPTMLLVFAAWQIPRSTSRQSDLWLMLIAAATGFVIDSVIVQAGIVSFAAPLPWRQLEPVWMLSLWASFALTLNHSMGFLQSHAWAAAALGAIGGPLAYWVAEHTWLALTFHTSEVVGLTLIAALWAGLMPLLAYCARQFKNLNTPNVSITAARIR